MQQEADYDLTHSACGVCGSVPVVLGSHSTI